MITLREWHRTTQIVTECSSLGAIKTCKSGKDHRTCYGTKGIVTTDGRKDVLFLKVLFCAVKKTVIVGLKRQKCVKYVEIQVWGRCYWSLLESDLGSNLVASGLWIKWLSFAYLNTFFLLPKLASWPSNSSGRLQILSFWIRRIDSIWVIFLLSLSEYF